MTGRHTQKTTWTDGVYLNPREDSLYVEGAFPIVKILDMDEPI